MIVFSQIDLRFNATPSKTEDSFCGKLQDGSKFLSKLLRPKIAKAVSKKNKDEGMQNKDSEFS